MTRERRRFEWHPDWPMPWIVAVRVAFGIIVVGLFVWLLSIGFEALS